MADPSKSTAPESNAPKLETRIEERTKNFLQPIDFKDLKKKKEDHTVTLRKSKRAEEATKRRQIQVTERPWIQVNDHYKAKFTIQDLPELLESTKSIEEQKHLYAAQGLRKLLSQERHPPIQEVIDSGVVPIMLHWIQRSEFPQLQFEATWVITNIASGTHQNCQIIVEKGAVPLIIKLLESPVEQVREQAIWALGNIGGDATHCRDLILQHGGLPLLIQCVENSTSQTLIKNGSWAISNLCRGKPSPDYKLVKVAVNILAKMLITQNDHEILTDCCWALSNLSEGSAEKVQVVIDSGCVPRIVQLLTYHLYNVQLPALRTLGNIATGDDKQTQYVIELQALPAILNLLSSNKENIRKEAVWCISNICAGSIEQLTALNTAGIFPVIINMLISDKPEIRREAIWAICNAASSKNPDQIGYLVQHNAIPAICSLLGERDVKTLSVALEGLNQILRYGSENFRLADGSNPFAVVVDECGGLAKLETLQSHPNTHIYNKALSIIEKYFEVEADESTDLIQAIKSCTQFQF
jgi:importin subunit alpha-1